MTATRLSSPGFGQGFFLVAGLGQGFFWSLALARAFLRPADSEQWLSFFPQRPKPRFTRRSLGLLVLAFVSRRRLQFQVAPKHPTP